MKSRRWPNSPHWQLLERTFRMLGGRSWRRAAAGCLCVGSADLRRTYDCTDLSDALVDDLHARLKAAAAKRQKAAEAKVLLISRAGFAVQIAQDERLRELRQAAEDAAVADPSSAINRLTAAFIADMMLDEESA